MMKNIIGKAINAVKQKINVIAHKEAVVKIREKAEKKIGRDNLRKIGKVLIAAVIFLFIFSVYEKIESFRFVKVSGTIEGDEVRLSFRVQGQITELLTDEGEYIKIGDVVAKLNTDELSKKRNEALAALKAGEYGYKLSKINYERAQELLEQGSVSTQDRDEFLTKYEADGANVKELTASLELAETRLGFTDLLAPLNGFVLAKSSLAGEVVQPGTPVFTAIDLNNIWVTAYINERDLGKVKLQQKAYVKTDSYRYKKYDGWVSFISQEAEFTPKYIQTTEERVKYVYRIKVRVDNSSLDLKPGMPADAYMVVD